MATKSHATSTKPAHRQARGTSHAARLEAGDIIDLILEEHKPLKELIEIMKDSDKPLEERQDAFEQFGPTLQAHAKPEEQAWYVYMKDNDVQRMEGFEGDVEHGLADQLCEEIKRTTDEDLWSARVKVVAELVEHHIEEEEEEILPEFKKNSTPDVRERIGAQYIDFKTKFLAEGGDDSPSEDELTDEVSHETEDSIH